VWENVLATIQEGPFGPLVDLDDDGDLDYLGRTWWLENHSPPDLDPSKLYWTVHGTQIRNILHSHKRPWGSALGIDVDITSCIAVDLDGDGDKDIVALALLSIVWFENLGDLLFGDPRFIAQPPTDPSSIYLTTEPHFLTAGDFDEDVRHNRQ
jgi:hypothetical protein